MRSGLKVGSTSSRIGRTRAALRSTSRVREIDLHARGVEEIPKAALHFGLATEGEHQDAVGPLLDDLLRLGGPKARHAGGARAQSEGEK